MSFKRWLLCSWAALCVSTSPDLRRVTKRCRSRDETRHAFHGREGRLPWRLRVELPADMSRRWGEMEARPTMIWMQPPGTASMGHLFLDAYHATGDEYYYQAAEQVGAALIWGQHPSGGWNYLVDFAGDRSLRDWYDTVGAMPGGWRNSSTTMATRPSTTQVSTECGDSSCCGCTPRNSTRATSLRWIAPSSSCSTASTRSAVAAALPAERRILASTGWLTTLLLHLQRRRGRRRTSRSWSSVTRCWAISACSIRSCAA